MNASPRVSKIGLYQPSTPTKCGPDEYVESEVALRLVRERKASFINHKSAVRMRRPLADPEPHWESNQRRRFDHRGLSAHPGQGLMTRYVVAANADRDIEGRAAIDCWPGQVKCTQKPGGAR